MPALQTSSSSPSALALSSSSIVFIVMFMLLVLGGSAGYFFVVPCARRAVKERRARTKDVENSTSFLIRYPMEKVKKAAAAAVLAKARAGLPITLKRSVSVVPVRKFPGGITARRQFSRLAEGFDGSTRFGASRTRTRPGPSPLRAVTLAPEPAVDHKKADAASHLVTARIRLAVNAKKAGDVIGQSPFGAVRKTVVTTRPHLLSLIVGEVHTRFSLSTRAMPNPSPLRRVCATPQSGESITESTTAIEKPAAVHEVRFPEVRASHKHERCPTFIGWTAGSAQSKGKGKALDGSSNAGTGGRSRGSAKGGSTSTISEKGVNNGRGKDKENQMALLRVPPRPSPRPSPLRPRI
ncbi:hypothetical protein K438DRAFT_1979712 [Mycena galopus ATCC 62051]|nr:hypothetical protein K438DRAFT_1979712 [Mycena galopus ATCC 62051]